ncbi:MAG: transcriptional regulator [Nitrososphaerales archaeon]
MTLLTESDNAKAGQEEDEQLPKSIALTFFRFSARRGVGVYYSLLATVPILVGVLDDLSAPSIITLVSVALILFGILFLARIAGMKRFYQMNLVMGLFERERNQGKLGNKLKRVLEVAVTPLAPLLPLVAAAIFDVTGSAILSSLVLIGLVAYEVIYYIFVYSKHSVETVLPWRIEDWAVALSTPALLLLAFFKLIDTTTYLISLILLLLLAGLKSSYQAPQTLVQVMNEKNSATKEPMSSARRYGAICVSEISSAGPLSSFTRVGIMLALLGVEKITFTDLMFAVKVSKSSLNHSVNALAGAGYVSVRKGFKTAGGPRTFIQITKEGDAAIRAHMENMQTLASNFLS